MKTNQLSIAILLVAFMSICWSCSDNSEDQQPKENENASIISELIKDNVDIRLLDDTTPFKSANAVPESDIDITQYAIQIKDSYGDFIYLNELTNNNAPRNYIGYSGVFISKGWAYKASACYNTTTKDFSAVLPYKYDIVFLYNCSWKTTNYFEGAYCFMMEYSTSKYPNKLHSIKCLILKGSFPNMND